MTPWPSVIYGHVKDALSGLEDFRLKSIAISNPQKATSYMDKGLSIGIPSSSNSPNSRDRTSALTTHQVTVMLTNQIKMLDQEDSYLTAIDDGERVRGAIIEYIPAEADVRFSWLNTTRAVSPSGDYIVSMLTFQALTCAVRSY